METLRDVEIPAALRRAFGDRQRPGGALGRAGTIVGVAALLGLVAVLLYQTGGMPNAYVHLAYLPILLAASVFGLTGGVVAALVAGVVVAGPLMPMDTATGAAQPLASWAFRAGSFVLIGIAAGLLIGRLRDQLEQIKSASFRHPVSELPTQAALEWVVEELRREQKSDEHNGLITIDIRNFNQIFNTLGSDIMPHIPAAVAERLRPVFRLPWQIFHVHSGKVAVISEESGDTASDQARHILHRLSDPVEINTVPVYLDAVVGVASFDDTDTSASAILQRSNIALAEAHRRGVAMTCYDQVRNPDSEDAVRLLTEAPGAIRQGEFRLVYQPQLRLSDGRVVGAEALLRWQHPERGLLSPGQFIPLLEATALINELTAWVARAAIRQAAEWQRAGLDLTVAINVSPRNIDDPRLFGMILDEIHSHELEPRRVELEITESAIINDAEAVERHLAEVKEAGVRVSLDDFGDGYTSVRHLTTLPIDKLKIDRSLIDRVTSDTNRRRVVSAIIRLADDLGLRTVAEGVEDGETEAYLRGEGCDIAQGFHYSKPVTPGELVQWLETPS